MKSKYNIMVDFFCVGPQRTGTTWIYDVLSHHQDICLPHSVKETMFFDKYYDKGIDWYLKYYKDCEISNTFGEVCPTYFDSMNAADRIKAFNNEARILISLRDPVKRTFSLFLHHLRKGRVSDEFFVAIKQKPQIVNSSKYGVCLPIWLDRFTNIEVVFFEDIKNNPEGTIKFVYEFLDVSFCLPEFDLNKKVNSSSMPKYPFIAKIIAKIVTQLHRYRLHQLVTLGKKIGFNKVYSGGEEEIPKITNEISNFLYEEFYEDIRFIEEKFNKKLDSWHYK